MIVDLRDCNTAFVAWYEADIDKWVLAASYELSVTIDGVPTSLSYCNTITGEYALLKRGHGPDFIPEFIYGRGNVVLSFNPVTDHAGNPVYVPIDPVCSVCKRTQADFPSQAGWKLHFIGDSLDLAATCELHPNERL